MKRAIGLTFLTFLLCIVNSYGLLSAEEVNENTDNNEEVDHKTRTKESSSVVFDIKDQSEQIQVFKEKLKSLGYNRIQVSKTFTEDTKEIVKTFQEKNELEVTGALNVQTQERLVKLHEQKNEDQDDQEQKDNQEQNSKENDQEENESDQKTKTYELGDEAEAIKEFKEKIVKMGYEDLNLSNAFTENTKQQIKVLQKEHNLELSGTLNQETQKFINENFNNTDSNKDEESDEDTTSEQKTKTYELGDEGEEIQQYKMKLIDLGYDNLEESSKYTEAMKAQIKTFQNDNNLEPNGILNRKTQEQIVRLHKTNKNEQNDTDNEKDQSDTGEEDQQKQSEQSTNSEESNTFEQGDRSSEIITYKEYLNALGFGQILVTEYFGSFTEQQVTSFQKYHSLEVNGKLTPVTQNKLEKVYKESIAMGDRDERLSSLKTKLNRLGYGPILVTNYFGGYTESQVEQFQLNYGLVVNGLLDSKTISKLNNVYSTGFQVGARHEGISNIKNKLKHAGFGGMLITDYFGNYTESRVKDFQEYYNLKITGTINDPTYKKLEALEDHPLQKGRNHQDLPQYKKMLNTLGFGQILETDYFGQFSEKKVKQFQRQYNLIDHGILDNKTLNKLTTIYNTPLQEGNRDSDIPKYKKMLNDLGFGNILVTNYFGSYTKQVVQDFQSEYNLPDHGVLDELTINHLTSLYHNPLQQGNRHNDIPTLKRKLNALGFGGILVTNYFGDYTEQQVKEFQNYYNLPDHGILDQKTIGKINEIFSHPLQQGNRHEDIVELKKNLNSLGYDGIWTTNYFGSFTEKRLKEFQQDYNLPVNGIADDKTMNLLDDKVFKVFIDPGHGDHDSGGTGFSLYEKDVVLDIALSTVEGLEGIEGIRTNISRDDDSFVVLEERSVMANDWGADFFLSVHNNAFNGQAHGFETYIHDYASETEKAMQESIHNDLMNEINAVDRGQQNANFNVLRNTDMPAILIEYLFIDNYNENQKLEDPHYRDWLGEITSEAILDARPILY